MPELPEVETVRRGLLPAMEGAVIQKAFVNRPDLRWPFPDKMAERLTGARVKQLRRRSKYILADLDTNETLIIHLGMSGRMLVSGTGLGRFSHDTGGTDKHDHVVFEMEGGARVVFNDPRRFGAMDLGATDAIENHWLLKSLGPEPLGNHFDESYLVAKLKPRKSAIKTALLDQRVVAGLGNIYVCEVLFRAGINPTLPCARISKKRLSELVPIVRDVLQEAIAAGGSSLKDYRQADGDLGYFQHSFQAYGREHATCVRDGCSGVIRRFSQGGRSTFACSQCQR